MSKGIDHSCANIWRSVARAGGWWSVLRLTREWAGIYSLDEVGEHLARLKRGGFLESKVLRRDGTVFAFTTSCLPLPGETLVPVTPSANEAALGTTVAQPRQTTTEQAPAPYVPPSPSLRLGALDHQRCPSVFMNRRVAFKGEPA